MAREPLAVVTTPERSARDPLEGFWAGDEWDLRECPLGVGRGVFRFVGLSPTLCEELKHAVRAKLPNSEWNLQGHQVVPVNRIVAWLAAVHPNANSLLDRPLEAWVLTLQVNLMERGLLQRPVRRQLTRVQEAVSAPAGDPTVVVLRSLYAKLLTLGAPRLRETDEDIWDVRRLGVTVDPADSQRMLNFTKLEQPWLRAAAKRFVHHVLLTRSFSDARGKLGALTAFSAYLEQTRPGLAPQAIDRAVIVDYLTYLRVQGFAHGCKSSPVCPDPRCHAETQVG